MFACGRKPRHPWVGESDAGSALHDTGPDFPMILLDKNRGLVNLFMVWSRHENVNYIFV